MEHRHDQDSEVQLPSLRENVTIKFYREAPGGTGLQPSIGKSMLILANRLCPLRLPEARSRMHPPLVRPGAGSGASGAEPQGASLRGALKFYCYIFSQARTLSFRILLTSPLYIRHSQCAFFPAALPPRWKLKS